MMPKARRPRRKSVWPFGQRGNRRVKLVTAPALARGVAGGVRRSLPVLLVLGVAALISGAGLGLHHFLTRSSHFAVKTLRFSPTQHVSAESLTARAGEVVGLNLFRVDLEEIARDVMQ